MPYTAPTLTVARTALAERLNDQAQVRWIADELDRYIREALRTWNAWTLHFRDQGSFVTVASQAFYDLPTEIAALRGQTLTSEDLVTDLQYALIEAPNGLNGGVWAGTDQFDLAQLTTALQRRRDQFLRETGAVLTQAVTNYPAPVASGRLALDEAVFNVRRAAWTTTATGILYPMLRTDEWAANNYNPPWPQSSQPPTAYSVSVTPPITLQLIPPATGAGDLDLVSIEGGVALPTTPSAVLGVPDDYAWVLKYGALADLLSGDGLALDPPRAAYCEERWRQGIEHASTAAVVLAGRITDLTQSPDAEVPVRITSLSDADRYDPTWQRTLGTPTRILLAGQTLVALLPPPDATVRTITLDLVRNAPVPTAGGDILQISQDVYDTILDLAQHTALFKEGPGQTRQAMALLQRVAKAAGVDLHLQQASTPDRSQLIGQTEQDRRVEAEQRTPVLQGVEGE
jgi:hypothetical protein